MARKAKKATRKVARKASKAKPKASSAKAKPVLCDCGSGMRAADCCGGME